jgi:hypothetical protein
MTLSRLSPFLPAAVRRARRGCCAGMAAPAQANLSSVRLVMESPDGDDTWLLPTETPEATWSLVGAVVVLD